MNKEFLKLINNCICNIQIKKIFFFFLIFLNITNVSSKEEKLELLIFAPASIRDALEEVTYAYELDEKIKITNVFLGTSQLAKQIYNGANPDIFISANKEWMNFVEEKKLILNKFRLNYLTNSLVVITHKQNFIEKNRSFLSIKETLKDTNNRISLALVNAVPAGIYAKQALKKLDIWNDIKNNLAQSTNVRTAMQFVSRGDLDYAIVYKSDVIAAKSNIQIIFEIDKNLHDEIIYPMVLLNDKDITIKFYNYLREEKSLKIMEKWGFKKFKDD